MGPFVGTSTSATLAPQVVVNRRQSSSERTKLTLLTLPYLPAVIMGCTQSDPFTSSGFYTLERANSELQAFGNTQPVVVPQSDTTFMVAGGTWIFNPGRAMDHHVAERLDAALAKVGGWSACIQRTLDALAKEQVGKTIAYSPMDIPVRTAAQGACVMRVLESLNSELVGIGTFFTEASLPQTVVNKISQSSHGHGGHHHLNTTSTTTTETKIFLVLESEGNDGVTYSAAPAVPAYAVAVEKKDPMEEMKKLKELLDMGALTQGEFDSKKTEILARI
jgi:hypothetical protein